MAKKSKEPVPAEGAVSAEETATDAVAVIPAYEPESMPEPIRVPGTSSPSIGQRISRFFAFLFRLLLVLLLLGAVGVGLYFGLPLLYQRYIVPVQENTAELQQLRHRQVESEQAIADLQARLTVLETQQAAQAQALTLLDTRLTDSETEIAAHTKRLASLEEMQSALKAQNQAVAAELERQVVLMKATELLSRARLYLYQSNFGLARQDVQAARDLLAGIRPDAPDTLAADLDAVFLRLDLALPNLPDFPVAASDDLDIAWQILIGGLPAPQPTASATPVPDVTSTPTPQSTLQPTPTP